MVMKTKLKNLMEQRDLNISQLSREINVSNAAIRGYMNNSFSRIDCNAFEKICRFFDVSIGEILYIAEE